MAAGAASLPIISSYTPRSSAGISVAVRTHVLTGDALIARGKFYCDSRMRRPAVTGLGRVSLIPSAAVCKAVNNLGPKGACCVHTCTIDDLNINCNSMFSCVVPKKRMSGRFSIGALDMRSVDQASTLMEKGIGIDSLDSLVRFKLR